MPKHEDMLPDMKPQHLQQNSSADIAPMSDKEDKKINVLSIDAWRDAMGWSWNDWHKVGTIPLSVCSYTPRRLLAYMRTEGYLTKDSAGKIAIEDDGYNIVIMSRNNRRPLFALEYGAGL